MPRIPDDEAVAPKSLTLPKLVGPLFSIKSEGLCHLDLQITFNPMSDQPESNKLTRYIVFLKPPVSKHDHLSKLPTRLSLRNFSEALIEMPDWNDDFIKGYVITLDKQSYYALKAHEDVHLIDEDRPLDVSSTVTQ